jgi:hypothetical protein
MTLMILMALMLSAFRKAQADEIVMISLRFLFTEVPRREFLRGST